MAVLTGAESQNDSIFEARSAANSGLGLTPILPCISLFLYCTSACRTSISLLPKKSSVT